MAKASGAVLVLVHVVENRSVSKAFFAEFTSAIGVAPVEHAIETYKNALMERGKNIVVAAGEEICRSIGVRPKCILTIIRFSKIFRNL